MRKLFAVICLIAVACLPAMAQVNVTLSWDASTTPSDPANPILYKLYVCSDSALANCVQRDAADKLTVGPVTLAHQTTTWFYVTARNYVVTADGVPSGQIQESDKSNVLQVKAFAPPGNPSKNRITVTQVGTSTSGQVLFASINNKRMP